MYARIAFRAWLWRPYLFWCGRYFLGIMSASIKGDLMLSAWLVSFAITPYFTVIITVGIIYALFSFVVSIGKQDEAAIGTFGAIIAIQLLVVLVYMYAFNLFQYI